MTKEELIKQVQQLCAQHGYYYSPRTGIINHKSVPDEPAEQTIYATISDVLHIKVSDLTGNRRTRDICDARFIMWAVMREIYPGYTLKELGRSTGGRDHSSVINGMRKHEWDVLHHDPYRTKYEAVRHELTLKGFYDNVYKVHDSAQ